MIVKSVVIGFFFLCLLIVGFILLFKGLWPRRIGNAPFCRKCGYNLTGLTGIKCSECGSVLKDKGVVYGERPKRKGLIVAGALCCFPLLLFVGTLLADVNCYQFMPTFMLISDSQSASQTVSYKAWRELNRRIKAGKLSSRQHNRLIELCLTEQGRPREPSLPNQIPIEKEKLVGGGGFLGRIRGARVKGGGSSVRDLSAYVNYLGLAYSKQLMSTEQSNRFFEQMFIYEFDARSRVVAGCRVPYKLRHISRCPDNPWWVTIETSYGYAEGEEINTGKSFTLNRTNMFCGGTYSVPCPDAGMHTLHITSSICVYVGPSGDPQASTLQREWKVRYTKDLEVLATEPTDYITMVNDRKLDAKLQKCFKPLRFEQSDYAADVVEGDLFVDTLPVNVACDVRVRANGKEFPANPLLLYGNKPPSQSYLLWGSMDPSIKTVDLVLSSSERLVRESLDMYEAWQGELVIKDVPITWTANASEN